MSIYGESASQQTLTSCPLCGCLSGHVLACRTEGNAPMSVWHAHRGQCLVSDSSATTLTIDRKPATKWTLHVPSTTQLFPLASAPYLSHNGLLSCKQHCGYITTVPGPLASILLMVTRSWKWHAIRQIVHWKVPTSVTLVNMTLCVGNDSRTFHKPNKLINKNRNKQ